MVSCSGGQPTGTTAAATDLRMSETASPRRNIWTECPASESASPCRNGKAALVGSSEPQALFIITLSDLCVGSWPQDVMPRRGRATSWRRKDLLAMRASKCEEESIAWLYRQTATKNVLVVSADEAFAGELDA